MNSLRKLYGNVDGYDFEEEYSIIERTIIHERDVLVHKPTYLDCFRGVNRVSRATAVHLASRLKCRNEPYRSCCSRLVVNWADCRLSVPTPLVRCPVSPFEDCATDAQTFSLSPVSMTRSSDV